MILYVHTGVQNSVMEACGAEVPVVGECLLKGETAHHDERQMIHESGRPSLALTIAVPGGLPVINALGKSIHRPLRGGIAVCRPRGGMPSARRCCHTPRECNSW